MRRASLIPAVLALLLAACGTDEGDASPTEEPMESMGATESMGNGDETGMTLEEVMNDPESYTGGSVTVSADVASAIESANAWILEAQDQDVLLIGPGDNDAEFTDGDAVTVTGTFMEFSPAQVGELEGVVDEAAIVNAFNGEYVVVADSVEPAES